MLKSKQAIELKPSLDGRKKAVLHNNVISLGNSEYQCVDCGRTWKESITSPQILDNGNVSDYYRNYEMCNN